MSDALLSITTDGRNERGNMARATKACYGYSVQRDSHGWYFTLYTVTGEVYRYCNSEADTFDAAREMQRSYNGENAQ